MATNKPPQGLGIENMIAQLASKVGVAGTSILTILFFFIVAGSEEQHKLFFDQFILLKSKNWQYITIVGLVIIVLIISMMFRSKSIAADEKIVELKAEVKKWQDMVLKDLPGTTKEKVKK